MADTYRVFVRDWWRREEGRLVPNAGARGTTIARRQPYSLAQGIAQEWNRTHEPGPLSRKAEFEKE